MGIKHFARQIPKTVFVFVISVPEGLVVALENRPTPGASSRTG